MVISLYNIPSRYLGRYYKIFHCFGITHEPTYILNPLAFSSSSSFSSYEVLRLFSTGVMSEFVLPCSLFISFQPEWFQFLLVHCTRHSSLCILQGSHGVPCFSFLPECCLHSFVLIPCLFHFNRSGYMSFLVAGALHSCL